MNHFRLPKMIYIGLKVYFCFIHKKKAEAWSKEQYQQLQQQQLEQQKQQQQQQQPQPEKQDDKMPQHVLSDRPATGGWDKVQVFVCFFLFRQDPGISCVFICSVVI